MFDPRKELDCYDRTSFEFSTFYRVLDFRCTQDASMFIIDETLRTNERMIVSEKQTGAIYKPRASH